MSPLVYRFNPSWMVQPLLGRTFSPVGAVRANAHLVVGHPKHSADVEVGGVVVADGSLSWCGAGSGAYEGYVVLTKLMDGTSVDGGCW